MPRITKRTTPQALIRRMVRRIVDRFHPEQVILFGSHARGDAGPDSDVDLLVVMPARDQHAQAVRILYRLAAPFPIDLLVRTSKEMAWRLEEGESFTTTIVSQGKVLYEKGDKAVGPKSRRRLSNSSKAARCKNPAL